MKAVPAPRRLPGAPEFGPATGRALVPVPPRLPPMALADLFGGDDEQVSATRERIATLDARHISPRQIADLSMDLYVAGALTWEEYALLAFQPELHPDYERTIGALTGEPADPDRPRDFIAQWEKRLAFDRKHNARRPDMVARSQRIVEVLRQLRVNADDAAA